MRQRIRAAAASDSTRIAVAYVAQFATAGLQLPYWPVWLAYRGMEPDQIGVLLGVMTWARLAVPWIGSWADRRGRAAGLASWLSAASFGCAVLFGWADNFVALLLLSALFGLTFSPILPLIEGVAVAAAAAARIDYGRVRSWGSAAFVIASTLGGLVLGSPSLILGAIVLGLAALFASTRFLPHIAHPSPPRPDPAAPPASAGGSAHMVTFLAAIAFLQGSHAVLYGFGTRHWQAIGIPDSTIGWLWAWGVIAEVALFAVGARLIARFRPAGLLVAGALGGLVRWPLLASLESPGAIFLVQTLHAATFASMHLGAMSWIRDKVGAAAVQRATGLYSAIGSGVALGIGMPLAGILYERFAGQAYHAMAISSGIGLLFALSLVGRRT